MKTRMIPVFAVALALLFAGCSWKADDSWTLDMPDDIPSGPGLFTDGDENGLVIYDSRKN